MPTPPPSAAEHLQSTLRRYYNREIRDWFDDVDIDDLDINVARQSIVQACKHLDDDSMIMTIGRQMFFENLRGRFAIAQSGVGQTTLKDTVRRRAKPQIVLYFLEDFSDVDPEYTPVPGRISIRLMNHTPSTMTEAIARTFATRIKTAFAAGSGFVWKKGKLMCTYTDWENGYQLQVLSRNETEGKRVIEQVLDINNDTPDWQNFNKAENGEPTQAYPTIPDRDLVYGKVRRQPRRRPIADVRFQYATLQIAGLTAPITLVDRTGLYVDSLVS